MRAQAPDARVLAVVKADAYGHGLVPVARMLAPLVDGLAVARLDEGEALRAAGIESRVLLLAGAADRAELVRAAALGLGLVVHRSEQVDLLAAAGPPSVDVWLKIDTGMHRLGVEPAEVAALISRLNGLESVRTVRVMSHLANADRPARPENETQLRRFADVTSALGRETSLLNSAGVFSWPEAAGDWIRPGIALYGGAPVADRTAAELGLKPVMTFSARLIAINQHIAGDAIGYGGAWVCPEDMPVGVVGAGYGDGYPRHAPSGTPVLLGNRPVPLIGTVSMDTMCVDLRGHEQARVGDSVTLWGAGLPADAIAERANTIAYELFCGITARVEHVYRGSAGPDA